MRSAINFFKRSAVRQRADDVCGNAAHVFAMSGDEVPAHEDPACGKTLLIAVSDDRFFMSHRLEIGRAAIKAGWRVIVVAGAYGCRKEIEGQGMEYVALPAPEKGLNSRTALTTIKRLRSLLKANPDCILHLVGLQMILFGNIAARLTHHKGGIVNAVSGLGISFQQPDSIKAKAIAGALRAFRPHPDILHTTIFQNREDEAILRSYGIISEDDPIEYIKGSGVDLTEFTPNPVSNSHPHDRLRVIFSGRLLRSKGVTDLIEAAEILRPKWSGKAEFIICGIPHTNPDSLTSEEITDLCDGQYIRWIGHCDNMAEILRTADIMAFPSYYREGLPKSLIEASAAGLPIVTCDNVGCRDTIDGNGILVEPRNPRQLAAEIDRLLSDDDLRRQMGRRSRALAERDYDIRDVVHRHLEIYRAITRRSEKSHRLTPTQLLAI